MQAISIKSKSNPENSEKLEQLLRGLHAYKSIGNLKWRWQSRIGNIFVNVKEFPGEYSVVISATDNSHITQERISNLKNRIREIYPGCEVNLNPDF